MRSRFKSLWELTRRLFPFRPGGVTLLAGATLVVTHFARSEGDYLLFPAGVVALVLSGVALLSVTSGALWLSRHVRQLPSGLPNGFETNTPQGTHFRLPTLRAFLMLDLELEWVEPPHTQVHLELLGDTLTEVVRFENRGRISLVTRRFHIKDIFGLTQISFDFSWSANVRVAPLAAQGAAELSAGRAQGDALANPSGRAEGDMVEMRQYAHGDSVRHVLWKAYARTRKLLVRMPERALAPGPVNVAFFVAGPDDEASAGAARLFLESGLLGLDLAFGADGATTVARTAGEAVEQLIDSSKEKDRGATSLETLAAQVDPARLSSCLVFTPGSDGPWRERVVGFVRRYGMNATVIIGVDSAEDAPQERNRLKSWLFRPPVKSDFQLQQLMHLKQHLEAEGLAVKVLHRGTGQLL